MHLEILSEEQRQLIPLITSFKNEFYLACGTAIALHIGHRRSIDFDLFKQKRLNKSVLFKKLDNSNLSYFTSLSEYDQINLIINNVKLTFFQYPYAISSHKTEFIPMPNLLTLAAMKAFALGRRSKWKDYVDLYFLIKDHYKIEEIVNQSKEIFGKQFVEKQFYAQLGYFSDINYDEEVDFLVEMPPTREEIQSFLYEASLFDLKR